jgi:CHAT domain-containing protein
MPTDLIILSGTALANKNVQGGAVQVFSRGLSYAGARNVMISLWNLPQDSRMTELVSFYKNKKAGMGDAQSLRQAQLLVMSRNRSPRSWAAFQLLGPGM